MISTASSSATAMHTVSALYLIPAVSMTYAVIAKAEMPTGNARIPRFIHDSFRLMKWSHSTEPYTNRHKITINCLM